MDTELFLKASAQQHIEDDELLGFDFWFGTEGQQPGLHIGERVDNGPGFLDVGDVILLDVPQAKALHAFLTYALTANGLL